MASPDPRASPLADWHTRFAAASGMTQHFAIREIPFATQINVRGNAGDPAFVRAAADVLGIVWPLSANTWSGRADCAALWLGPDEWLVAAREGRGDALYEALGSRLAGTHHAITDVSANRSVIEISGRHVRSVLAKGCSLDLHARSFAPPQCAQSLLAKAQVILQCIDVRPLFRLYVRTSLADYLATWLLDAATETLASLDVDAARTVARLD